MKDANANDEQATKRGQKGERKSGGKGEEEGSFRPCTCHFFSLFNFFLRHVRVATKVHIFSGISPQANFSKCWLK